MKDHHRKVHNYAVVKRRHKKSRFNRKNISNITEHQNLTIMKF